MAQWVGDIVIGTKQSWRQQPVWFILNIQENLDLLHNIQMVGTHGWFTSKLDLITYHRINHWILLITLIPTKPFESQCPLYSYNKNIKNYTFYFRCANGFTGPRCNEAIVDELTGATLGVVIAIAIYIPISCMFIFVMFSAILNMRDKLQRQERKIKNTFNRIKEKAEITGIGYPPYPYSYKYVLPISRGQRSQQYANAVLPAGVSNCGYY